MTRSPEDRFGDILGAIERCQEYREFLDSPSPLQSMAYDAVLRNLAVIGEAARAIPLPARAAFSDVPWAPISGLRNVVIHEYFRIDPDLILDIIDNHLVPLAQQLRASLRGETLAD